MCRVDKGGCGQRFRKHECRAREHEIRDTQEGEREKGNALKSDQTLVMLIDANMPPSASAVVA
jgi:hypothetical protein